MTNFTEWYDTNREAFNAKRRERYQKDKEYRNRVQGYTRRYRAGTVRKGKNPDGTVTVTENGITKDVYRIYTVIEMLSIKAIDIRILERQGYIPKRKAVPGKRSVRSYTKFQVALIGAALEAQRGRAANEISKSDAQKIITGIFKEWSNGG